VGDDRLRRLDRPPARLGSFARKYSEYVVRRRVLSLREFIERSTALTADTFGLADRGRLRPGAFADIVVFDPRTFAAHATYEQPTLLASGVRTVIVNGVPAVENGKLTGAAAGRALAKTPPGRELPMRLLRGWFAIPLWQRVLGALALGLLFACSGRRRAGGAVHGRPVRPRDPDAGRADRAGHDRRRHHQPWRSQADRRPRRAHHRPVRPHHRHRRIVGMAWRA
jgi:hypothetical protein